MDALAIGIGNTDRGDDGAGISVVRRLRGWRTMELDDSTGLIDAWAGEEDVIVIDAMQSGRPAGAVIGMDAADEALNAGRFVSSHAIGLADIIELARALGRLPARLTVYGIEAERLDHGDPITPAVMTAVERLAAELELEASH